MKKYTLLLSAVGALAISCGPESAPETADTQVVAIDSVAWRDSVKLAEKTRFQVAGDTALLQVLPSEEHRKHTALRRFLGELTRCVKKRKTQVLLDLCAPDVLVDHGATGYAALEKALAGDSIWLALEEMLALGGAFDNKDKSVYTLPYTFARGRNPQPDYPQPVALITAAEVPAFAEAAGDSVVRVLNYEYVWLEAAPEAERAAVRLQTGEHAYVPQASYARLDEYRCALEEGPQGWRIFALLKY